MDRQKILAIDATCTSTWSPIHDKARDMLAFAMGAEDAQWDPVVLMERNGRAAQQYPIVKAIGNQIKNPILESPPEISVYPGDGANKTSATAVNGLLRHIQYKSQASRAYMHAFDGMLYGGVGAWRISLEDEGEAGDKEICIEYVEDPTCIEWGPCRKPDYSDARYVRLKDQVAAYDVRERWGDKVALADSDDDDLIPIYELWIKEGRGADKKVMCYVHDEEGTILETISDYKGKDLPVVMLSAPSAVIKGKLNFFPLTYELVAVQREINWLKSEAVSVVAAHPKSKWLAEDGAIDEGDVPSYAGSAASDADAILYYKKGHEKPDLIPPPDPPVGYMQLAQSNLQMARDITGIYPDQGQQIQGKMDQASGKALKQQRAISNVAGAYYADELKNGLRRTGEILLDLIKHYMNDDKKRISLGGDMSANLVSFGPAMLADVQNVDLEEGEYGVVISSGASYATQREELLDRLGEMASRDPQVFHLIADYIVEQWPIPGTEELADRFRIALLPPNVQQMIAQKQSNDPRQQAQALMMQLQMMSKTNNDLQQTIKALIEHVGKLDAALKDKSEEIQSRERVAQMSNETTLHKTDADNATKVQLKEMDLAGQSDRQDAAHIDKIDHALITEAIKPQPTNQPYQEGEIYE